MGTLADHLPAGRGARALRLLLVLQVAAIALLAVVTAARFPIWAHVDERAHYAYVQTVAEEQRLPHLDDLVSPEVQAITDRTWPQPSPNDPAAVGLAGRSYEAFQPPLYYVLAAPFFALPLDHRDKVYVLRGLGVLLLGVAVFLLVLLARMVFGDRYRVPLALALAVVLWPGLIVRTVTASNAALELPLAVAFTLALWHAHTRRSVRALFAAAVILGLALLTKLTLAFLCPVLAGVALLAARRHRIAALALVIPGLMLAPWLAANVARFGTLTLNAQALEQQTPFLYPDGRPTAGDLPERVASLPRGSLPQEWFEQLERPAVGVAARGLPLALLALALAGMVLRRRSVRDPAAWLLGAPVLFGLLTLVGTFLSERHDVLLLRYLAPALPAFALFAAAAWARERETLALAAGSSVVAGTLWVWMAGSYYFTDVGGSLGIG
jgi:4-amino-4-deoxy-L-arabinose transferase-like glycosyltransferase